MRQQTGSADEFQISAKFANEADRVRDGKDGTTRFMPLQEIAAEVRNAETVIKYQGVSSFFNAQITTSCLNRTSTSIRCWTPTGLFDSLIHGALAPFMVGRGELCGDSLRVYDDFDSQPGKNPVAYRLPTYLGRVYWISAFN